MNKTLFKKNNLLLMMYNMIYKLPTPININIYWNSGSLLGLMLMIQIISGLFLSMHYTPSMDDAFNSIIQIMQNVNYGSTIRFMHMNGASFYFIIMYIHISRGLYYQSFKSLFTWLVGLMIFLLSMMTAFMGYILPWGQMSFWGATVITNLISAIPYIGMNIVQWMWGNYSVSEATLKRFFSLHFIMPMIISLMVMIHLMFLHSYGSNNPFGTNSNIYKTPFHPYYTIKDLVGILLIILWLMMINNMAPNLLNDPDNYIPANPMSTPEHIQPEWYFLFAYSILRAIPNKLGGVIAMMASILILSSLPLYTSLMKSNYFFYISQHTFWMFIYFFMTLTWLGTKPIEYPYILLGQIHTMMYFSYMLSAQKLSNWQSMN
uniref:Cytochrome b n=1 Tax=Cleptes metallicorpus TaxID=2491147 RepID=A0A3S8V0H9_9HYME|nr:cytochrome b [Cleptes metallicorpus]